MGRRTTVVTSTISASVVTGTSSTVRVGALSFASTTSVGGAAGGGGAGGAAAGAAGGAPSAACFP